MLKSMRKEKKEKAIKIAYIFKTKAKERERGMTKGVQIKSLKFHTLAVLDQSV